jgi:ABC-2 type transport system ATP-binding protein
VHKQYGNHVALDGIDLQLHPGELLAVLGPNGAGKTSAIALLLGLLKQNSGQSHVFGGMPGRMDARRQTGLMLQSAGIPDAAKVSELLDLTRSYYPNPRSVADCVALAGLEEFVGRSYGKLSGGQQRRVQFALAICGRPQMLFLDEPTTGLDVEARRRIWSAIRELVAQGCGVLLTTHYLEEAEALADRIVVLNQGHVVAAGTVAEIRANVSQRRLRCISVLEADYVASWPGVRDATRESSRLEIVVDLAEPTLRRLLAEDDAIHDIEIQRAGLADAFIQLTKEAA